MAERGRGDAAEEPGKKNSRGRRLREFCLLIHSPLEAVQV